ncbi:hypothetical protein [Psychrobacter sp. A3]|uniref:hypothetical protein n=1 Tax=Psychrobacter sp. A3 TaxID=2992754 RepID=UPI00406C2A7A
MTLTELIIAVFAIGILASIGIPAYQDYISNRDTTIQGTEQNTNISMSEPAETLPTVAKPSSGIYAQNLNGQQAIAPLEIRTDSGSDYYVKVVNAANDNDTLAIYIHGGETVEVEVPLGSYEIRYASGNDWYGDKGLFGIETSYNKADELFTFSDTGYQISGYTITLYQVANGNLQTKSIDESQF